MKNIALLILAFACTGCATKLPTGEYFSEASHTTVGTEAGRIIVYHGPKQGPYSSHKVAVVGGHTERLVFGGFLSFDLPPGKHAIHAKRKSSGEGVMAVLSMGATAIASAAIDDDEAQFVFTASPGQVTYLMLEDRQIERRYECQEEDDTARICTKMVFAPQFSVVASNKAVRDLRDLVEIDE
jgi:hypothetical protein